MIRSSLMVCAVVALGLTFAASAHAGGGGGVGTKARQTSVPVWIKNVGAATVQVNAQSGPSVSLAGGSTLAAAGKRQFSVKSGQFSALVRGVDTGTVASNLFNASGSAVYLYAEADNTAATITVGKPF